jgi:hypothetical protein
LILVVCFGTANADELIVATPHEPSIDPHFYICLPMQRTAIGIVAPHVMSFNTALELSPGLFMKNLRPVSEQDVLQLLRAAY